jgi:hypothetical protein
LFSIPLDLPVEGKVYAAVMATETDKEVPWLFRRATNTGARIRIADAKSR